jgi:hypothetical protein
MRTLPVLTAVLLLGSLSLPDAVRAEPVKSAKCGSPELRQFDFWAGDWDTYDLDAPDKIVARNRVGVILDGCALREVYDQPTADGRPGRLRATWQPRKDGVRETAELSTDGGKTWKPLFDIVFRRHPQEKSKEK